MMSRPYLVILRRFSTSKASRSPLLSPDYRSQKLWDERFNCKLLSGDENLIRAINSKIVVGSELNNLEMDVFVNIANPDKTETDQLRESADILARFRRTLYAHTMLPSTPHAVCRLFLYSQRLASLVKLLENRLDYGVFPDSFAMNLLLDEALDKNDYLSASRLAALVMLQEEFSCNQITDRLSLLSLASYIELKTDFEDWASKDSSKDLTLEPISTGEEIKAEKERVETEKKVEDDDEDEDDAEYIRIPFLRNPYNDNHFDLKNPRILCGKTLRAIGFAFMKEDEDIGMRCTLLGSVLQGKWSDAINTCSKITGDRAKIGSMLTLLNFYTDNLHEVEGPDEELKKNLVDCFSRFSADGHGLSELAKLKCESLDVFEKQDIDGLRDNLTDWSRQRLDAKQSIENRIVRDRLIEEVRDKKKELKRREDYLYFYENLRRMRKTRIEYD